MFSPYDNENLIKENTTKIADNELYSFGDSENKSLYNPSQNKKATSGFANLANISNTDEMFSWKESTVDNVMNKYYKSPEFKGVSLYRPLCVNNENALEKNIYNYSFSSAVAVRGMAFTRLGGGNLNNPMPKAYNIVDNSYEFNRTIVNSDFTDVINETKLEKSTNISNQNKVEIMPIAAKTFDMQDVLLETDSSRILTFKKQENSLALEKVTPMSTFWAKQRNIIENLKNMFVVKKQKAK